ncbi:MAG: acylphosphatase [Alphaproteobacteria bacterium]|nr:acylphosphatase [Alphaproteobacteria bacterium]
MAIRLRIEGRVQAVWYRGWTVDQAQARGLRGWVRNRPDGSVEALLIGSEDRVRDMVAACWQGPPAARVVNVVESAGEDDGTTGFRQRPTG